MRKIKTAWYHMCKLKKSQTQWKREWESGSQGLAGGKGKKGETQGEAGKGYKLPTVR